MERLLAHPPSFSLLREHDDGGSFVLPDHLPEVINSVWQRALCCDELFTLCVALHILYRWQLVKLPKKLAIFISHL